jgi:ABC-type antimicrobial peptide transport system permease subunit
VTAGQRELGIRVALGARAGQVLRMVLARAGALVVIGGVTGLIVSWWATTLVASLLHGTPPRDAMAFGAAAVVILAIGLAAAWIPARTAARTDAAVVLRDS